MGLFFVFLVVQVDDVIKGPYDPNVPRMQDVLGFDFGADVTSSNEVLEYANALANASPYVDLKITGRSWEKRPLPLLIITSEQHLANLEVIKKSYRKLAQGRDMEPGILRAQVERLPVCVWLAESVHGNEASGTDSGLALAYQLAASQSAEADSIRQSAIVLVYLLQNPDGRDRFVEHYRRNRSARPNVDPLAVEHQEPWPSGRPNHYLFDLNRDWFALTQAETQAKVATYLDWRPQVAVDLHEMGTSQSFFVATPAAPINPLLPKSMVDMYQAFGQAIATEFDRVGIDYFHSEVFDGFYPGYGESWPSLQGSVGLLFEQARVLGQAIRRSDGSVLTHREAVSNQLRASVAVIRYAVHQRTALLNFFHQYRMDARTEDKNSPVRQLFFIPGRDPLKAHQLATLLTHQGIEVQQLGESLQGVSLRNLVTDNEVKVDLPDSTYSVRFNQPASRLARSILLPQIDMDDAFIEEQNRRFQRRLSDQIFDITGWSLPLVQGVPTFYASGVVWKGSGKSVADFQPPRPSREAKLAYLIPYGSGAMASLSTMLRAGVQVSFIHKTITQGGRDFVPGSLVVRVRNQPANIHDSIRQWSLQFGFDAVPQDRAWFESGPSLGSSDVSNIRDAQIAMVWGEPASSLSAGWLRYAVEQLLHADLTLLDPNSLGRVRLNQYHVLIVPNGSAGQWARCFGDQATSRLDAWIRDGGVLIGVGSTLDWLIESGWLGSAREYRGGMVPGPELEALAEHPEKPVTDPQQMTEPMLEFPRPARGALVRAVFETDHWLAFGMEPTQTVMVDSDRVYRPLRLDKGQNLARYVGENLLMAGFVPDATQKQLANKAWLMVQPRGLGFVIGFAEEPVYRGMATGCLPLLANAIFFSSAVVREAYP